MNYTIINLGNKLTTIKLPKLGLLDRAIPPIKIPHFITNINKIYSSIFPKYLTLPNIFGRITLSTWRGSCLFVEKKCANFLHALRKILESLTLKGYMYEVPFQNTQRRKRVLGSMH